MKWDSCASSIRVTKLFVRAALSDFCKSKFLQYSHDFFRFEYGILAHASSYLYRLNADEFGFYLRLVVFEEHCYDFL